ncbi:MAG: ABC transporter substrate-binding protein, partial [Clostridia bacterium]|nr:ABC transporter substrate-binding protein [Clostridia bacterium]
KGTAVVGYISILDLSRAGDIIRSRTFEAVFPLVTTAVIYLILSWILSLILNRIEFSINPRKHKEAK